jgi:hypothetical protein
VSAKKRDHAKGDSYQLHLEKVGSFEKYKIGHVVARIFAPVNTCQRNGKAIRELLVLTPWNQVSWWPACLEDWQMRGLVTWKSCLPEGGNQVSHTLGIK